MFNGFAVSAMISCNFVERGTFTLQQNGIQKDYTKWQTGVETDTSVKNDTRTSVKNDTKTSVKNDTHKRQKTIKYNPNSDEVRTNQIQCSFSLFIFILSASNLISTSS
jgi:hypothetical protein